MMADRDPTTLRCGLIGGTGFLGRHIAAALSATGAAFKTYGRRDIALPGRGALARAIERDGLTDLVLLAAHADPSAKDPQRFYAVNAQGTLDALSDAAEAGLPGRFVMTSATSVYGQNATLPTPETAPLAPLNHYGASKLLAETYCGWFDDRLSITIARPSNCFGLGQNPAFLPPKLVAAFAARDAEITLGDASIARDFVDVRDAADIFARCLLTQEAPRRVNVSSGVATPISALIEALAALTGHRPSLTCSEQFIRQGDMTRQACANDVARSIGHTPKYPIAGTLGWMLSGADATQTPRKVA